MIKKYNASITFKTKDNHPDDNTGKEYTIKDVYTIDEDYFYGLEDIIDYIKNDLALVGGGGYATDTIKDVVFNISHN